MVEFAMLHARACAHALHVARGNAFDVAHAVFVRQVAAEHVADDFHVSVRMRAKACARGDPVFVDDPQATKTHVRRVVVAGE